MGCKDCDEERAARAAYTDRLGPPKVFSLPLERAEIVLTARGTLDPLMHSILKDWLGLVYEQLAPPTEAQPNG